MPLPPIGKNMISKNNIDIEKGDKHFFDIVISRSSWIEDTKQKRNLIISLCAYQMKLTYFRP